MGLPEFREEFEAFKKTLPDPGVINWHPNGFSLPDPDLALDRTELMFYQWWAAMAGARDEYRAMVLRQEGEALRYGLDVGVPVLLEHIDWVLAFLEGLPAVPDWNASNMDIGQRVELMDFAKRYVPSIQRWLSLTRNLRDSVQSMVRDFDSRDGRVSFLNE